MSLVELKLEIPAQEADAANDVLLENGCETWSVLEDAIARRAWLVGIFQSRSEADESWAELKKQLRCASDTVPERRLVGDAEWKDSYKAHFKAWQFGRLHWVPVWERETFRLSEGEAVLWLDPGLAFGTGNHETTRLCVERLVRLAEQRGTRGGVVDAGCGSGILALSAAKLGFSSVIGFDNDPEAVRVSEENGVLNGLADDVQFFTGDLTNGFRNGPGDVVLANILANVLIQFRRELAAAVAPGGTLILSGILAGECEQVRTAFHEVAPRWAQDSRTMGEWSDVVLTRPR